MLLRHEAGVACTRVDSEKELWLLHMCNEGGPCLADVLDGHAGAALPDARLHGLLRDLAQLARLVCHIAHQEHPGRVPMVALHARQPACRPSAAALMRASEAQLGRQQCKGRMRNELPVRAPTRVRVRHPLASGMPGMHACLTEPC